MYYAWSVNNLLLEYWEFKKLYFCLNLKDRAPIRTLTLKDGGGALRTPPPICKG